MYREIFYFSFQKTKDFHSKGLFPNLRFKKMFKRLLLDIFQYFSMQMSNFCFTIVTFMCNISYLWFFIVFSFSVSVCSAAHITLKPAFFIRKHDNVNGDTEVILYICFKALLQYKFSFFWRGGGAVSCTAHVKMKIFIIRAWAIHFFHNLSQIICLMMFFSCFVSPSMMFLGDEKQKETNYF
jgi:hypothetical protein